MSAATTVLNLTTVTDPLLYGALLDWAFLGILAIQVYLYTTWYFKTDSKSLVALVFLAFAIEIAETGLATHAVRQLLSVEWGNVVALSLSTSSFTARAIPVSLVTTVVQLYFAWRIHALGRRLVFTIMGVLVALISVAQCATGIAFGVLFLNLKSISAIDQVSNIAKIWSGVALPCGIIIAGVFSYLFWTFKGNMLNENVLVPVVSRTMQSSVLAALASLCHVAFFVKAPIAYPNITVIYLVGKLYANILLLDLNRRQRIHNAGNTYMDLDPMPTRSPSPMSQREAGTVRALAGPRSEALSNNADVIDPFTSGLPANPPADPEVMSITSTALGPPPTYRSL